MASITSSFTKRSSSMASLQKGAEDEIPIEIDLLKNSQPEQGPSEAESVPYGDYTVLPINPYEKEYATSVRFDSDDSSLGSIHKFPVSSIRGSYCTEGQNIGTPPLRTSSANSPSQTRTAQMSTGPENPNEEKENMPRVASVSKVQKHEKRRRGMGRNKVVVDGIRSFFR